ncbi:MAG: penicillin acylase family protein [Nocardioides sp.]|nr:penicillin acylase family protein [Nocardioides sp.]
MSDRATVHRDRWGIPHLRAPDVLALARLQGRVTAYDRAWQLEHARHRAEGGTASYLGADGVEWDVLARRARLVDTAQRAFAALDDESQAFLTAYADGVTDGLGAGAARAPELAHLDLAPGEWQPWTPVAVWLGIHLLFAGFPTKLWRDRVLTALGEEGEPLLQLEEPLLPGSNGWLVTGARTRSGHAVVAGDPHRLLENPGVYQQVHLACPGIDVFGLAVPGVPGLPHFGHAGSVAWAITNAAADTQDLYRERLRAGPDGTVQARGPAGWEAASRHVEQVAVRGASPVDVEVVETLRGPVVHHLPDGDALSLRQPPRVLAASGLGSLLPLLRARTVADVDAAVEGWVEPVNVLLAADRDGGTLHRTTGRVPHRSHTAGLRPVPAWEPAHAWAGWHDPMPRREVPSDGIAVMANEAGASAPLGIVFAPPHRAERIRDLLGAHDGWDATSMADVHTDTRTGSTSALLDRLTALEPTTLAPGARAHRDALLAWDRRMEADSRRATTYADLRAALVRRLGDDPCLAALHPGADHPGLFAPWTTPAPRLAYALERVLGDGLRGVDLDAHLRAALADLAAAGAPDDAAPWGEHHRAAPLHALDADPDDGTWLHGDDPAPLLGLGGDNDCVLATTSVHGISHRCSRGPVARYVWDLGDPEASRWVVPLGASGVRGDPHQRDQLEAWRTGVLPPVELDPTTWTEDDLRQH